MPKANVLIVEDDWIVAEDTKITLKKLGFSVSGVVTSGEESLKKVEAEPPDLVLMDIKLEGEMDGIEAAERIRDRFNIPVVYVTGYADGDVLERAKVTEPFGYIVKPFEDREINSAIEIALYKHEMETKLKESEAWLYTTLKSIGDAVITTDTKGIVTFMNPVARSLTGWRLEEAMGRPLTDVFNIINEETRKEVENPAAKVLMEGRVVSLANHTLLIAKGGTEIPIDDSGAPIVDEKGDIIGTVLVFRDVGEKRAAEKALKNAHDELEQRVKERTAKLQESNEELAVEIEERLRSEEALRLERDNFINIMNAMEDGAYIVNKEYEIEYVNQKIKDQFGETGGRECFEYFHDRQGVCPWCKNLEVFEGKTVRWNFYLPKNQRTYDIIDTPLRNMDGTVSKLEIFRDVTDLKNLQAQLVRTERLAATGQLAASIAHEINSPLQAVTFMLSSMGERWKNEKELMECIRILQGAFRSIRDTVKNLLDLNRPGKDEKQETDVNRVIEKTIDLVRIHLKKSGVKLNLDLSPRIPGLTASPQGLSHVFLNLFNNAIEAMSGISKPHGGETGLTRRGEINVKTNLRKGHVVIRVADNGPGIPKEDLEHIFDPFYTRKKKMGLGVGLSVCHDIVKSHGGTITAENGPGGGAVFTITMPLDC